MTKSPRIRIYANRWFAKFAAKEKISDATGSVANMGHGRAASPSWGIRQHWRNAY
jgi:hypothetical protein